MKSEIRIRVTQDEASEIQLTQHDENISIYEVDGDSTTAIYVPFEVIDRMTKMLAIHREEKEALEAVRNKHRQDAESQAEAEVVHS